jgi:diaminopimelate epimerase
MTSATIGGLSRSFWKMAGAGNDFLVFAGAPTVGAREAETIRRLCRRGTGVGADGVLFVTEKEAAGGPRPEVRVDYFNADGGRARFCANGTRCAARFAALRGVPTEDLVLYTGWGAIAARVRPDGNVTLFLPEPIAIGASVATFDPAGREVEPRAASLAVGVPHLVVFCAEGVEVETLDVATLGPPLRRHPDLPDGANVNFVSVRGGSRLSVRTFERGVEAETLSCGSGVVAAAVVAGAERGQMPPVSVATRSGSALVVGFRIEGSLAHEVTLTGDARVVYEGLLKEEAL